MDQHRSRRSRGGVERCVSPTAPLDRDQTRFYGVVTDDPARLLPILYDAGVGEARLTFGHIRRGARGRYLSHETKGAAEASADRVDADQRQRGMPFPSRSDILRTELARATRVAEHMFDPEHRELV